MTGDPESPILNPAAAAAINHLLRGASWARDELRRFAGRTARIEVAPLALTLTVLESGEMDQAAPGAIADVALKLTPGLLLRLAARDEAAWKEVDVSGDTEMASCINHLARNLRWDFEEDLSRFFGDVAAHRMAEAGRAIQRWGSQTTEHVGRSLAEYWTEEQPLIASARDVNEFNQAVDALRDDVARLEKRVEYLLNRQGAKTPRKSQ